MNVQFSNLGGVHMIWGIGVTANPAQLSWEMSNQNCSLDD
jgi:hypothetical protein